VVWHPCPRRKAHKNIEKIIDKINIKKASGFDNIPAKVIKQCKPIISNH
jgi:hypothetical protein